MRIRITNPEADIEVDSSATDEEIRRAILDEVYPRLRSREVTLGWNATTQRGGIFVGPTITDNDGRPLMARLVGEFFRVNERTPSPAATGTQVINR